MLVVSFEGKRLRPPHKVPPQMLSRAGRVLSRPGRDAFKTGSGLESAFATQEAAWNPGSGLEPRKWPGPVELTQHFQIPPNAFRSS